MIASDTEFEDGQDGQTARCVMIHSFHIIFFFTRSTTPLFIIYVLFNPRQELVGAFRTLVSSAPTSVFSLSLFHLEGVS
jgi:hypothetical protein